jgi:hypothetical protein
VYLRDLFINRLQREEAQRNGIEIENECHKINDKINFISHFYFNKLIILNKKYNKNMIFLLIS